MVRSYRSRHEIIVDILRVAFRGAKKTHIMQGANLNPSMFHKYFPKLLDKGLILKRSDPDGGFIYNLSEEGKEFLKLYISLQSKLGEEIKIKKEYIYV